VGVGGGGGVATGQQGPGGALGDHQRGVDVREALVEVAHHLALDHHSVAHPFRYVGHVRRQPELGA